MIRDGARTMPGRLRRRAPAAFPARLAVLLCLALAGPGLAQEGGDPEEEPDPLFDDFFDEEFDEPAGYPDPLEETNRGTFAFNRLIDRWILDPVTEGYRWLVPEPGRKAISRVFANLAAPKILVNDLLQLEWKDASVTSGRMVVNTTVGLVGLFDVAEKIGLEPHDSDFGQTLALAGTPSGPYVVLPLLGPSTVRDGIGTAIDGFFQPTYYILGPSNVLLGPTEILLYTGSSGISTRDRHYLELKSLEDSSIDFYAAMRSGYYQDRVAAIWTRRPGHRTTEEPEQFSFSDDEEPSQDAGALGDEEGASHDAGASADEEDASQDAVASADASR